MKHSQYNEEDFLLPYFAGKRGGFLVDVGAADGVTASNSRTLIDEYEWMGVLIEPLPSAFAALQELYADVHRVRLVNKAVGAMSGTCPFYPSDQVSTVHPWWKERAEQAYPETAIYSAPIVVQVDPLTEILDAAGVPRKIDLLTVDAEGSDMDVLRSLDWRKYIVDLVIVEGRAPQFLDFFTSIGFHEAGSTAGNIIFGRDR